MEIVANKKAASALAHRASSRTPRSANRARETLERVRTGTGPANTPLKRGVNESDRLFLTEPWLAQFNQRLATRGFRFTPQRQHVYDVLLRQRDHPTAEEIFLRSKKHLPDISMATVYNCLTALVKCGLVRQVVLEQGASRFCPNMHEHCHFYCDRCDNVFDIDLPQPATVSLPKGFRAERYEIAIHGRCPACAKAQ